MTFALWDHRSKTNRILYEWDKKTTRFQSKEALVPELFIYSHINYIPHHEVRLPNHLIETIVLLIKVRFLFVHIVHCVNKSKMSFSTNLALPKSVTWSLFVVQMEGKSFYLPEYMYNLGSLLLTWINFNHMPNKVRVEFSYLFPNSTCAAIRIWEWISNSVPHYIMGVITYPCRN